MAWHACVCLSSSCHRQRSRCATGDPSLPRPSRRARPCPGLPCPLPAAVSFRSCLALSFPGECRQTPPTHGWQTVHRRECGGRRASPMVRKVRRKKWRSSVPPRWQSDVRASTASQAQWRYGHGSGNRGDTHREIQSERPRQQSHLLSRPGSNVFMIQIVLARDLACAALVVCARDMVSLVFLSRCATC
jgi:hypothetical protein